uniref:Uncharacterized protein n=1 Tax=Mucochytrium quahogii TaxID=96639 RepID=A0A7S2RCE8_9STRA|mmetsp:Transcript_4431/g.6615  ORF Transcript_4431/g.6615 Transcript_4431/m.6615 type:complete len:160 (-) Transcript_4431:54-533(-)|eukprot:CAMPEP_0203759562 /NCGR_PEP_ID=MMETSP0098-20131031/12612_1 /ASSEMBLY_ACC=CAM_ASM_000208 /TAXON_ID=96639 /ORGANISM=" , Strain NY0313808BC1" /LENGTH=159 /DNA_ID=CAMNT_0050652589 /DNA_START=151 /DNA_END=630 /DNA_ORIENTATION=+
MFPYVATGLAGLNLLLAILGMALNWAQVSTPWGTTGSNLWVGIDNAQFNATKAFLVLAFVASFATVLLCAGAVMKKVSWVGALGGNVATAVFALISFACYAGLDVVASYGPGFGCIIAVFVVGLAGAGVCMMAHKNTVATPAPPASHNNAAGGPALNKV